MNKKTVALNEEQYREIIGAMRSGFCGFEANERTAAALVIEANLGLRISDVLNLRLINIVKDGRRRRLDITERKTGKKRVFTIPDAVYDYLSGYCKKNGIGVDELIFPIKERVVQRNLSVVCDYLGYTGISTHSFRKYFATQIYENNGKDIMLVQTLLQHSSPAVTQKYIGISTAAVEDAINKHICLI